MTIALRPRWSSMTEKISCRPIAGWRLDITLRPSPARGRSLALCSQRSLVICPARSGRVGVGWMTVFGLLGLVFAVWGGQFLHQFPMAESWFQHDQKWLAWAVMIYGFAASALPVWLLLTPRDYLSTFLKLGTVVALALAVIIIHPTLQMPALSRFVDGTGLVFAGPVFPFVCITIACGAVSGFHSLISSGTTCKMIEREARIRDVGYGAMVTEMMVALMAMIAAC